MLKIKEIRSTKQRSEYLSKSTESEQIEWSE